MNNKFLYIFSIFYLFIGCKKEEISIKKIKTSQLSALNNYDVYGEIKFIIYSDNSYCFIKSEINPNHKKVEKFTGFIKVKKDTINFFPSNFEINNSTKAVIKNNFIEFVDGETPLKIEIKKNTLLHGNNLNFEKVKDFSLFTYNENYMPKYYFGNEPNLIKPYDLKQSELENLNKVLEKCFLENKTKLRSLDNYTKQCITIINSKQEVEVWIGCYCKNTKDKNRYKYDLVSMSDGGNCNVSLKINLTKQTYSNLNISSS